MPGSPQLPLTLLLLRSANAFGVLVRTGFSASNPSRSASEMLGCHFCVSHMQREASLRIWKHDIHVHIYCMASPLHLGAPVSSSGYVGTLSLCKIRSEIGSCCQGLGLPGDLFVSTPELALSASLSSPIVVIIMCESLLSMSL